MLLVGVRNFVEEAITINSELVDDPLNDWLHLHEGKYAPANLLVEDFDAETQEFHD